MHYLVAGRQKWNRQHFSEVLSGCEGTWDFCESPDELEQQLNSGVDYRYVFFLHWSHVVDDQLLAKSECVCFHLTDVPYGRGGSPLQNLIARGHRDTKLTALRMTSELDAGPVYMKVDLSLEGGTAEEIYQRASRLSCELAREIAETEPDPVDQCGDIITFRRRQPGESEVPESCKSLEQLFDHIRMLDAAGYPRAFILSGGFRVEFSRAALYHGHIKADVKVTVTRPDIGNE